MTRIKICCISTVAEAKLAVKYGASAVGLVSEMPSGPGVIDELMIKKIAATIPPGISTFLLTSKQRVGEIIDQHKRCGTNTIQICDRIISGSYEELKSALPGIKIVQVIHVSDNNSVKEAVDVSKFVDALLLDSGNQNLKVKVLGGTGKTHDWLLSKKIVAAVKIPVFLAGGLNQKNVIEAIKIVKPFGVDICSGVRINGKLNERKLKLFVEMVRSAKV